MATNRLFAFNNGPSINGTSQSGNLSISTSVIDGYRWWPGPDEDLGYIIAHDDTNPNMRTEGSRYATVSTNSVGFWRSTKTDVDFLSVFNGLFSKNYSSAPNAAYWLNTNGYWTSYSPEAPLISQSFVFGGSSSTYNGSTIGGISDSGAFVKLDSDGTLDNTFSVGSGLEYEPSDNKAYIRTISIQSDGKIIAGGFFSKYNGATAGGLIRLNTDGSIDNTFDTVFNGYNSGYESIISTEIQPDGKILVGGGLNFWYPDIYDANKIKIKSITRLNSDGTLDTTFAQNFEAYEQTLQDYYPPKSNGVVYDIKVRPDGKIIAIGLQGKPENYSPDIAILNSDGSIDSSTTTKASATEGYPYTIALQPDGKILMGGTFITYGSSSVSPYNRNRLVRLNSDLTLDETFYTGNIGSNFSEYGAYYPYNFNGHGFSGTVQKVIVQYDGKILVGGDFTTYQGVTSSGIIRLNSDGSIDNTFNVGTGFGRTGYEFGNVGYLKLQADGKVIAVGYFNSYNGNSCNGIARLNSDGSFDNTYTIGTAFNFTPGYPPSLISDDYTSYSPPEPLISSIIVGGNFTSYNGTTINRIVKLDTNGSIDNTFTVGTGFDNDVLDTIKKSDGKIICGGGFTSYNGTSVSKIVRLNTDGSIDNTFNIGTGFNDSIYSIDLDSSENILIGGKFTTYNGSTRNRLVKLNSDGSIDNTFNVGTGFNGDIYTAKIQSDGKIICGGDFTSYNGTTRNRLVKLNSDGSIDNSFSVGTGFNLFVYKTETQSDGKIICGGDFTSYNGTSVSKIVRLNTDGSIDNTFNIGTGFNNIVYSIKLDSNGKILIGGWFTTYNGSTRNRLVKLNSDGTEDSSFYTNLTSSGNGSGLSGYIISIKLDSNGKILIGGDFTSLNGLNSTSRMIRLNSDGSLDNSYSFGGFGGGNVNTLLLI